MPAVLDASAVLAFLQGARSAASVRDELQTGYINAVNLAEVYLVLSRGNVPAETAEKIIEKTGLSVYGFSAAHALAISRTFGRDESRLTSRGKKPGLTLGDRACIVTGLLAKLPVITADQEWRRLAADVHGLELRFV